MTHSPLPAFFQISSQVSQALANQQPVVALESTVITHGLPYPDNVHLALDMEAEIRQGGATPATIAVLDGKVMIGVQNEHLERLGQAGGMHKISSRDFAPAATLGWSGGTTVAATMLAASTAGVRVFATGGIGGVHRHPPFDISADLPALASIPMIVVCAGAKAILDLPATIEYLETVAVPVVGYGTDDFPAFYSLSSGLKTSLRLDTPAEIARLAQAHWETGLHSAVLVANPPPAEEALPYDRMESFIQQALAEAEAGHIRGQNVTPFLLARLSELTGKASLTTNLALLRNNARLGAAIARQLYPYR